MILTTNITLPRENPSWVYEGLLPAQYEDWTGAVLNRAPKEIQENISALRDALQDTNATVNTLVESGGDTTIVTSLTAPTGPTVGMIWRVTNSTDVYVWSGVYWEPISRLYIQSTAPVNGRKGVMWFDTVNNILKIHNGVYYADYVSGGGGGTSGGTVFASTVITDTIVDVAGGETYVSFPLQSTDYIHVYLDTSMLDNGDDYSYDSSGITFTKALTAGSRLKIVKYSTSNSPVNIFLAKTEFIVATTATTFTYPSTVDDIITVYVDGVMTLESNYSLDGSNIIFAEPVQATLPICIIKMTPGAALTDAEAISLFDAIYPY